MVNLQNMGVNYGIQTFDSSIRLHEGTFVPGHALRLLPRHGHQMATVFQVKKRERNRMKYSSRPICLPNVRWQSMGFGRESQGLGAS